MRKLSLQDRRRLTACIFLCVFLAGTSSPLLAYVGPGAGIAFVSSFFIVIVTFLLAFVTLLTWPFRWALQTFRGRRALKHSRVKRLVIVGLDGQDPDLTEQFMKAGLLPHFSRLRQMGSYRRLRTVLPAESPVAWSSFQTGCNPGRHKVFDFLTPNRKSYMPELCSARVQAPRRSLRLGKYRIPLGKPTIYFGRKSQSFWQILGKHGVFSTVIRVPITFPAERFHGVLLSAMSVPDLKGTQGTFTYYSSDQAEQARFTGGIQVPVNKSSSVVKSFVSGPENPLLEGNQDMRIPFEVQWKDGAAETPKLVLNGAVHPLPLETYTPWIPLQFHAGLGMKINGMAKFYLKELTPHFKMYMSPLNIDPEKPALPISHPFTYAMYLAKTQGRFCTLGLAEDTWALNERVIDEKAFLEQTYEIHAERERMLFDAIEKTSRGTVVCVFDITDRLQHMFFRYLDRDHPANPGKDTTVHRHAIRDLYRRMDELVGRVLEKIPEDTLLLVMSDHGFKPFKRGVNLNSWLHQKGFLSLRGKPGGGDWLQDVDWAKTRAYAVGLGGIYINLRGREAGGIVAPGEERVRLKAAIAEGLRELQDSENDQPPVGAVYDTAEVYAGPYVEEAPDLIVGFNPGYRVSWSCATGLVTESVFEDNLKSWSGDHCMDPKQVPGILFSNQHIKSESPSIMDLAPTVLDLFGVSVPRWMDGTSMMPRDPAGAASERPA